MHTAQATDLSGRIQSLDSSLTRTQNRSLVCMGEPIAFTCVSIHGQDPEDGLGLIWSHGLEEPIATFTHSDQAGRCYCHTADYNGVTFFFSAVLDTIDNTTNLCKSTLLVTPVVYAGDTPPIQLNITCSTDNGSHMVEQYQVAGMTIITGSVVLINHCNQLVPT